VGFAQKSAVIFGHLPTSSSIVRDLAAREGNLCLLRWQIGRARMLAAIRRPS
jgi:hypothetical protein